MNRAIQVVLPALMISCFAFGSLAQAADGGEPVNGLQLALEVKPANWKPGDKIELTCAATNVSDKPIRIPAWGLDMFPPLEFTNAAGKKLPQPSYGCKHCREYVAEDFPTLAPGETKRFTTNASFDARGPKQYLTVWEGRGGAWGYELPDGAYQVSAAAENKDAKERAALPQDEALLRLWTGKAVSEPVKVTVGAAAPTRVDPAPKPGEAVNGLKMTLSADKTELKMTRRNYARSAPDSPPYDVEPAKLTFTFTNVSDKPIKLDTYDLAWSRLTVDVTGPDAESVRIVKRWVEREMVPPAEKNYPAIEPGKSWTYSGGATFPGNFGENQYVLLKPGEYRVKVKYARVDALDGAEPPAFAAGAWSGTLMSNEVVLKAAETKAPEAAPAKVDLAPLPGAAVKGLKLTLAADRTFLAMTARELLRAAKDTPRYNIEPAKLTLTFTNVGGAPIKLATYDWSWGLTKLDVTGPDPESVRIVRLMVQRMMAAPTEANYPTLKPGESWADAWQPSFPGNWGPGNYILLTPGAYRVRVTYAVEDRHLAMSPHAAGAWTGTVASNEVVFTAGEVGAPAGGVKLTISADRTEMKMTPLNLRRATRDQAHYRIEPVALSVTLANVSDKPIKVDAYDLVWSKLTFLVDGPVEHSVVVTARLIERNMIAPRPEDYHVIEPGKSWTFTRTIAFPGDIGGNTYVLNAPGEYRVKIAYGVPELRDGSNPVTALAAGIWRGTVVSNELVLKGVEADQKAAADAFPLSDKQVDEIALKAVKDRNEPIVRPVKAIEPQVSPLVSDSPATGGKVMIPVPLTNSAFRCVLLGYGPAAPKRAYACIARDGKAIYPFTVADFPAVLAKEDRAEWSDARYEDAARLYVHLTTLASVDGWVVLRTPKDFMAITFNMRKDDAGVLQREAASAEIKPPAVARAKDKVVVTFCAWHSIGGRLIQWTVEFGGKFAANSDEIGRFGGGGYD